MNTNGTCSAYFLFVDFIHSLVNLVEQESVVIHLRNEPIFQSLEKVAAVAPLRAIAKLHLDQRMDKIYESFCCTKKRTSAKNIF